MSAPNVVRCVCCDVRFSTVLDALDELRSTTVAELQRDLEIATGCGLCVPYVQRTIETGESAHPILPLAEAEALAARSGVEGQGRA